MASLNDIYVNILKEENEMIQVAPEEIWILKTSNDEDRYFRTQEGALKAACQEQYDGQEWEALKAALVSEGFFKNRHGLEFYLQKGTIEN